MPELPPVTEDEWWPLVGELVETTVYGHKRLLPVVQPFTVNERPIRLYGRVFNIGDLVIELSAGGPKRLRFIYRLPRELRLVS